MIVQLRVDDRLIHGQVALVWSKALGTNRIIVANEAATKNPTTKMTLEMGTPTGQKLLVKTVPDAIRIASDPRAESMRIFALTNCIRDALELVRGLPGKVESVNVANVGRFDKTPKDQMTNLNVNLMLNPDELEAARELAACGLPVYHQIIPSNSKEPLEKLLKGA